MTFNKDELRTLFGLMREFKISHFKSAEIEVVKEIHDSFKDEDVVKERKKQSLLDDEDLFSAVPGAVSLRDIE